MKEGASLLQWAQAVTAGPVEPPSTQVEYDQLAPEERSKHKLARLLKGDLDAVTMKALADSPPTTLPADASALKDDLHRYLDGSRVLARRERVFDRAARLVRRHRTATSAAAAAAAGLTAAVIGFALVREHAVEAHLADGAGAQAARPASVAADRKWIAVLAVRRYEREPQPGILLRRFIGGCYRTAGQGFPTAGGGSHILLDFEGRSGDAGAIHAKLTWRTCSRQRPQRRRPTACDRAADRADDGIPIWSQTYDRKTTDVFEVQDEIAGAVVTALQTRLRQDARDTDPYRTVSGDAHDHYLLGRLFANRGDREDTLRAAQEFRQAVALDSNYAAAYAALAAVESSLADQVGDSQLMHSALAAADRAIQLAPNLAEGYSARGTIRVLYLLGLVGLPGGLHKALSLEAGQAVTQRGYAALLRWRWGTWTKRWRRRGRRGVRPLATSAQRLGFYLQCSGDLAGSRRSLQRALELRRSRTRRITCLG